MDFNTDYDATQRIKIAQILADCKSDRLSLIAYVLGFDLPQVQELIYQSNNLVKWFSCIFNELGETTPMTELYEKYQQYCDGKKITAVSRIDFTRQLKKYFGNVVIKQKKINGKVHKILMKVEGD